MVSVAKKAKERYRGLNRVETHKYIFKNLEYDAVVVNKFTMLCVGWNMKNRARERRFRDLKRNFRLRGYGGY